MTQKKIVVVGSINLDLVASVETMPMVGETITGQQFATYSGGKGANRQFAQRAWEPMFQWWVGLDGIDLR